MTQAGEQQARYLAEVLKAGEEPPMAKWEAGELLEIALNTIDELKAELAKKLRRGLPLTDHEHAMTGLQPRPKVDAEQMWSANCACGFKSNPGNPHEAFKNLANHAKDRKEPE